MRANVALCLASLSLTACPGFPIGGDDGEPVLIATSGGSLQRLSASEEATSAIWTADIATATSVRLIVDGDAYVGAGSRVQAFDLEGTPLWSLDLTSGDLIDLAGPVDGQLYALTFNQLLALDEATGGVLWTRDLAVLLETFDAVGAASGGVLLAGSSVLAVDPGTGDDAGSSDIDDLTGGMQANGADVVAGLAAGVAGYDPASGGQTWLVPTDAGADVTALSVSGGTIAFSASAGGLGLVSSAGSELQRDDDGESYQGIALGGDLLVAARSDGQLIAREVSDFSERWSVAPAGGAGSSVPGLALSVETAFVAAGGLLQGVNLADGSELWTYQPDGSVVAVQAL